MNIKHKLQTTFCTANTQQQSAARVQYRPATTLTHCRLPLSLSLSTQNLTSSLLFSSLPQSIPLLSTLLFFFFSRFSLFFHLDLSYPCVFLSFFLLFLVFLHAFSSVLNLGISVFFLPLFFFLRFNRHRFKGREDFSLISCLFSCDFWSRKKNLH